MATLMFVDKFRNKTTGRKSYPPLLILKENLNLENDPIPMAFISFKNLTLCINKRILLLITIHKIRVYIVTVRVTVNFRQYHSTMIVTQHIRISVLRQIVPRPGHVERSVRRPGPDLRILLHEPSSAPVPHILDQLGHRQSGPVAVQRVIIGEAARCAARRIDVALFRPTVHVYVIGGC